MKQVPLSSMSSKRAAELEAGERRNGHNSTFPARTSPIGGKKTPAQKKRAEARKAREFARSYLSLERVFFVQVALQCEVPGCGHHPGECAHIEGGGERRKADYTKTVNLCKHHHRTGRDSLHTLGRGSFEQRYQLDLEVLAHWTELHWQRYGQAYVDQAKADGTFDRWLERRAT